VSIIKEILGKLLKYLKCFKYRNEPKEDYKIKTSKLDLETILNDESLLDDRFNPSILNDVIKQSSRSTPDIQLRKDTYSRVIDRFHAVKDAFFRRPNSQLINEINLKASIVSYACSFAGLLSIEKDMECSTDSLYFIDILDTKVTDESSFTNKFKLDLKRIEISSNPNLLVDVMDDAYSSKLAKSTIENLVRLYTNSINEKLVKAIQDSWTGDVYEINMSKYMTELLDSNSYLDAFQSDLAIIDTDLAKKSVKYVNATTYIVGEDVGNWFKKLVVTGNFIDNTKSNYINGLLGWYKDVPVLQHSDININEGYAIHKTSDGQLAPLIRGIYLPLFIDNRFDPEPTKFSTYYQEEIYPIKPELILKFRIN
jgi:hypothetical protein